MIMKQFFTFLLALCLTFPTAATAQFSKHESKNALIKGRERNFPADHLFETKEADKAVQLKNAAVLQHPSSSKHYNWLEADWDLQMEMLYDDQGRVIEMLSGLSKITTEYDDVENIVTKWHQQKVSELAPWTTTMKEITQLSDNYLYEVWMPSGGVLTLSSGSKTVAWEETQDNTTTEQWEFWIYNPLLEAYEINTAYKDETLVNDGGQILSYKGYYWEDGDWVLEYSDTYTYNSEDVLSQMTFCDFDEGVTECERLEFIFSGAGAPSTARVYKDEGSGYELTGRYINLVWRDWENVSFNVDDEAVLLFATMQLIIDPDGDINSDANYVNFEQFEYDMDGHYTHQYWVSGAWVIDDFYITETLVNGDVVTTTYNFDYEEGIDEDCDLFTSGSKQVSFVGPNHSGTSEYEWTKTSEPCGYEWVKFYEVLEDWTATTFETTTLYLQAETSMENIDFEEWNEYGHLITSTSIEKMGETIIEYGEYSYNNTYDGALRTSTIITFRDSQEGPFVNDEKIEYSYGGSTSAPNETISANRVFPTVFDTGFNVHLSQASSLKLISAQGQTVWQQSLTTGQLFVPANHLPQGIYILLISSQTGDTETFKLIKK
jgi:hypothetical protein